MFFHELREYRRYTIAWTLALVVLIILLLSLFPAISREAEEFKKVLEGFPEAVRIALGLSVENIGSILGYYSYIFLYISLIGAIQAMILGTSILSKEIREKTAEFLLTKPVTRNQIMTSKLFCAITILLITNVVYIAAAIMMASLVETKEYSIKVFLLLSLTLFYLQMIFLSLGIIVSVVLPKIKSVLSISLGSVFTFFIIGALVSTTEDEALRYLTPFKYFDFVYIVQNSGYELSFMIAALGFIVIAIMAGYYIYAKSDIHSV